MTPFEWVSIAGMVIGGITPVAVYFLRRLEKLELTVRDQLILGARLDERLSNLEKKIDLLITLQGNK